MPRPVTRAEQKKVVCGSVWFAMSNAMLSSAVRGCRLRFLGTAAQPVRRTQSIGDRALSIERVPFLASRSGTLRL